MKIIRDGETFELTSAELFQAWTEQYFNGIKEDICGTIDDNEVEIDEQDLEKIAKRVDKYLGRNDGYWESYWITVEDAIDDYLSEKYKEEN